MKPPQRHRWLSKTAGDERRIEYDIARAIDKKFGLDDLWMDTNYRNDEREVPHERLEKYASELLPTYSPAYDSGLDLTWPFPLFDRSRYLRLADSQEEAIRLRINELLSLSLCESNRIAPTADRPRSKRSAYRNSCPEMRPCQIIAFPSGVRADPPAIVAPMPMQHTDHQPGQQ